MPQVYVWVCWCGMCIYLLDSGIVFIITIIIALIIIFIIIYLFILYCMCVSWRCVRRHAVGLCVGRVFTGMGRSARCVDYRLCIFAGIEIV